MKVKLKDLHTWDKNEMLHPSTPERMEELKASISKNGQILSLLIDGRDNQTILGGNHQFLAMKDLGWEEAEAIVKTPDDDTHAMELGFKHNSHYAEYDMDTLKMELDDFPELELDDIHVFMTDIDLKRLMDEKKVKEDDFDEELDEIPAIAKLGDIYKLGEHKLICGDATESANVKKLLGRRKKVDMVFTDPPYLMNFEGAIGGDGGHNKTKHVGIINDNLGTEEGDLFLDSTNRVIQEFCEGAFYITFYRLGIDRMYRSLARVGLEARNLIIWQKNQLNLSNSDYKALYEPMFYGWVDKHEFYGSKGSVDIIRLLQASNASEISAFGNEVTFKVNDRIYKIKRIKNSTKKVTELKGAITVNFFDSNDMDIWQIEKTKVNDLHPTMKPVALCSRAILNSTLSGGTVLDLFGGSGSTLIACEQTGRKCYMVELDPHYCDVIIARWEKLTSQKAKKING